MIKSPVASIHFDPRGGDRFTVLFNDNTIAQYHLFAEDPSEAALGIITASPRPWTTLWETAEVDEAVAAAQDKAEREEREREERERDDKPNGGANGHGSQAMERRTSGIERRGSVGLEKPLTDRRAYLDRMVEWKNEEWSIPASEWDKKGEKYPWAGKNPLSVGRLGAGTQITCEWARRAEMRPRGSTSGSTTLPSQSSKLAQADASHGILSRWPLASHHDQGWSPAPP